MNLKITYNWLLEYLEIDANPYELQKYLSLSGPSVETVTKVGDDYVLDVEITSNRIDAASVFGIAQEAQAILPQFGKKAHLKPFKLSEPQKIKTQLPITVEDPDNLTNRILAVVLDNVDIVSSPSYIKDRLEKCSIRSLNNIIDITNYVMLDVGHPTHAFDYDRIKTSRLIFRKAHQGEKIVTLDGKTHTLTLNDIVIDDGTGRVIDLPGIMGTENTVITPKTKRVLFFIENNNSQAIRQTSMRLRLRTEAAALNDKGPDPERAKTAFLRALELFQKIVRAKIASNVIDIYPNLYKPKTVEISMGDVKRLIGIDIKKEDVVKILTNLGFSIKLNSTESVGSVLKVGVPSWRKDDISIKEDLVEEIARIYGYHNLPSQLQPMVFVKRDRDLDKFIEIQQKVKYFLKHLGLHEVLNYSMVSKEQIENIGLCDDDENYHLKLSNPITEDLKYMRTSFMPSLIKNIRDNQGKKDVLRFFEIAKIYLPQKNNLPDEIYKLGIVVNTSFSDLKGIIESLLKDLNITNYQIQKGNIDLFSRPIQANIISNKTLVGSFGQLKTDFQHKNKLKNLVFLAGVRFQFLVDNAKLISTYKPTNPYAMIKLDLTAKIDNYEEFRKKAFVVSKLLNKFELINVFKDKITVRFYFTSYERNLTEKEAQIELEKIKKTL